MKNLNDTWVAILSAIGLIGFGFSIGFWVASINKRDELRQKDLDCEKRIELEKKVWEKERKNDAFMEGFSILISNINKKDKDEKK